MRALSEPRICVNVRPKAGADDPSRSMRQYLCGYQSLQFSARWAYRPAAHLFQTGPFRAAHWGPLVRLSSVPTLLSEGPLALRSARSPIHRKSIWASLSGKFARVCAGRGFWARGLLEFGFSRGYHSTWNFLGERSCDTDFIWRPFWRLPLAATQRWSKVPSVQAPVPVRPFFWAVTWPRVQQLVLRPMLFSARPIRANATTQARHFNRGLNRGFDLTSGQSGHHTIKGAAHLCGAFLRLGRGRTAHV